MLDPLAFKNVKRLYGDLCVVCPGMHVYLCGTYNEEFLRFESVNKTVDEFRNFLRHNHVDFGAFPFGAKHYIMMDPCKKADRVSSSLFICKIVLSILANKSRCFSGSKIL